MSKVDFRDGSLVGKFGGIVGARTVAGPAVRGFTPRGVGPSADQLEVQAGIRALASISRGLKLFADARDFYRAGPGCSLMANLTAFNEGNIRSVTLAPSTVIFSKGKRCPILASASNATVVGGDLLFSFTRAAWFQDADRVRLRGFLLDRVTGVTWQEGRCAVGSDVMVFPFVAGMPTNLRLVIVGLDTDGRPWQQWQADCTGIPAQWITWATTWAQYVRTLPGSANLYSLLSEAESIAEALKFYIDTGADFELGWYDYAYWLHEYYGGRTFDASPSGSSSPWTWTIEQDGGAALSEAEFARLGAVGFYDSDDMADPRACTINAPARTAAYQTDRDPEESAAIYVIVVRTAAGAFTDAFFSGY